VKIGDLVRLLGNIIHAGQVGILVSNPRPLYGIDRFDVLIDDGQMVKGLPRSFMEVISEAR